HLARSVVAVEHGVELAADETLQRGAVAAELVTARVQGFQHAPGVREHQSAGRTPHLGRRGGHGGCLRLPRVSPGSAQAGGRRQGKEVAGGAELGVVPSSGAGGAAAGCATPGAALLPPPLNMYLPTICIRSTAGVVNTSSSPGLNT